MNSHSPIVPVDKKSIAHAVELLREGKLVAFPTETVYGLGADATQGQAVAAIYAAKGRPEFNPLIAHVAEIEALDPIVEWNDEARLCAKSFWPGPLTLVLPRRKDCPVSLLASAGLHTLAVRMPSHPAALQLLKAFGRPVVAPSANASGTLSPTTAEHVAASLGSNVDLILDGGKSEVGVESTVCDLSTSQPTILRPGGITKEQMEAVLGPVTTIGESQGSTDENTPRPSPGMMTSHYAPRLPLRMNAATAEEHEAFLTFGPGTSTGRAAQLNLSPKGDLCEAAANLFLMLHELDQPRYRGIAVMPIPNTGLGVAINDRLKRASVR